MNVWTDDWGEQGEDWSGGGALVKRLVPHGPLLGASLYELGPGNFVIFHFHHGSEELLIVPTGPDGAHEIRNDTDTPVRYVMAGTRVSPEIAEYPDLKKVTGQSQHGIFFIHDLTSPE